MAVLPIAALLMGMSGYRKIKQDRQDDEDAAVERTNKAEDRAYMVGQRERTMREQAAADADKARMRMAGSDVQADPNMVPDPSTDNRDVGLPGTAPPTQDGYRVAGKVVPDAASATNLVTSMNSVGGKLRRQSGAALSAGDPTTGAQLAGQADAWEANDALKEAGRLMMGGGWGAVPEIYARYKDGKAARVEEDGKGGATVITIDEASGKEVGRRQFADLPQLFATIAGRFDPKLWVADEIRRAGDAEGKRRWDAEQGVREKNADSQALVRAAQAEAAGARAQASMIQAAAAMERAAAAKAGKDPKTETPDATFDEKTAADIAKDIVKKEAEEAALGGKAWTGAQIARRKDEIVETLRATHTNRFIESNVRRVLSTAQGDAVAYANEYGKALKIMPQAKLAQMGFQPPAAPGATTPVPTPARPGAAAPAAAAAAPAAAAPPPPESTIQRIERQNLESLTPLAEAVKVAKQQHLAAARSGDPKAIATYQAQMQQAIDTLRSEAAKKLGNRAPQYLQTVL